MYDVIIAGGGLAGLSLSIQLAGAGYRIAVFEKKTYPFHKVCGEYIGLESWNFLEELGLPLSDWNLPIIRRLLLSSPDGQSLEQDLPLGGFGISRHKIDSALAAISRSAGVELYTDVEVTDIVFEQSQFRVETSAGTFYSKVACGTFGNQSNPGQQGQRTNIRAAVERRNQYIGVQYHVPLDLPFDMVGLHYFKDGYCSVSRIEDDLFSVCYLVKNASNRSIPALEAEIVQKNPYLKRLFASDTSFGQPVTISPVSFAKRAPVAGHILLIGDAAGVAPPLAGNGISMALQGSKIAYHWIDAFLKDGLARYELEQEYSDQWNRQFGRRVWIGRWLQHWVGSERRTNLLLSSLKPFQKLNAFLIRQMHGQPF